MRLGILSDTHDEMDRTRRAVELLRTEGAEILIHCGDLTRPEMLAVCAALPCYFVFGNHDADNVPGLQQAAAELGAVCLGWGGVVELDGKRVGVVHGHMRTDVRKVMACQPDYVLSGHSHIACHNCDGRIHRINPGALHEADKFTVALLEVETGEVQFVGVLG